MSSLLMFCNLKIVYCRSWSSLIPEFKDPLNLICCWTLLILFGCVMFIVVLFIFILVRDIFGSWEWCAGSFWEIILLGLNISSKSTYRAKKYFHPFSKLIWITAAASLAILTSLWLHRKKWLDCKLTDIATHYADHNFFRLDSVFGSSSGWGHHCHSSCPESLKEYSKNDCAYLLWNSHLHFCWW